MADTPNRKEKVAAGLKKLKQFQQRSKGGRKNSPAKEISPTSSTCSVDKDTKFSEEDTSKKVPMKSQTTAKDSQPSIIKSSSSTQLNDSACVDTLPTVKNGHTLSDPEIVPKSKSNIDLTNITELSSTESLRQITNQVNGLVSETHALLNGEITYSDPSAAELESQSLEKRNQELASFVNNLQQLNDQLQFQLQEVRAKNKRLHREFEVEKQELHEKSHKEQVSLKDQLQVHIQTIGILVAEKTELQSSLSLSQQTAKQKAGEAEELQGRLRASRQRAADLEKDLNSLNSSLRQVEKVNSESSKDVERLKLDNYKLGKSCEDFKQSSAELSEKLNKKINDLKSLENQYSECHNKLSLAELEIQQLRQSNSTENSSQLEDLHHQNLELEKRISHHKDSIDRLINERDQMAEQYQEYIQQLSQQVTSLRDEIKQLSNEKDALFKEKNQLQEKLDMVQQSNSVATDEGISELKLQIDILTNQKEKMQEEFENEILSKQILNDMLQKHEKSIADYEKTIKRLQEDRVDNARLVEAMQSDKVAASRAVSQNMELKTQLGELQNGFVAMSNDKLELAEKLHAEQHITKELGERLSQQEEELRELRDQVLRKDDLLQTLQKSNTKGMYQQSQIADRMRHYEAQGQLAEMLQKELKQAQEQISALANQNSELRMAIATHAEVTVSDDGQRDDKDVSKRNDMVASLSASVRQLEMERNQMMKQLEEQKTHRTNLEEQIKKKEVQLTDGRTNGHDVVSKEEYVMMKRAMELLEERFKKTMDTIAVLSDERQQLEHLVTQLQGETETIGDYIALYQIQRSLMHKRAVEKDDYIAQLAKDREDLKAKLGELESLIIGLVEEKKQYGTQGDFTDSNTDILKNPNKDRLCSEHVNDMEAKNPNSLSHLPVTHLDTPKKPDTTARKIIDLLAEIGTANLIEKPVLDNFHPCPVCSGRLITV